jgi:hypothetical protein
LIDERDFFGPLGHRGVGLHGSEKVKDLRSVARVTDGQQKHRHGIRVSRRDAGKRILGARPSLHGKHTDPFAVGDARETVGDADTDALLAADNGSNAS